LTGLAPLMPPLQFSFSMSCFKHTHTHTQIHNTHTHTHGVANLFFLTCPLIHTDTHTHTHTHTPKFTYAVVFTSIEIQKNIPSFSGSPTLFLKIGTLKTLEQVLKKTLYYFLVTSFKTITDMTIS
jgi:hypothetical protein